MWQTQGLFETLGFNAYIFGTFEELAKLACGYSVVYFSSVDKSADINSDI